MKLARLILVSSALVFAMGTVNAADTPAIPALSGDALAAAVKGSLDNDLVLQKYNLKVKGKEADVTIEGSVDEGEQMARAGNVAEQVKGVRYVFNNIVPKN
ncbi:BON domain-containing protein [Iodobacter violaceini]|nr:BON domain-containing protein [Iodobacter violacea]